MKVYRGYNNEVGPISYAHWIYVTPDIEQAKWYATKDGFVKSGAIIEYDMDKEHMTWISLSKINSFAEQYEEEYTENDLLWYQEDLANDLSQFKDGIVFQDPYDKKHTIYIVLNEKCLKNGRVLSKEEFDAIKLRESFYRNELNDVFRRAGVQLNESTIKRDDGEIGGYYTYSANELMNIIENRYKNEDVRVVYDITKKLYMISDAYSSIHFNILLYMILFTNVYDDIPQIKNNKYADDDVLHDIIVDELYLSYFKVYRNNDLSDEEFIKTLSEIPDNKVDGYGSGYICKLTDNLWAVCRDDEISEALQVPLLKDKEWIDLSKNKQLNESADNGIDFVAYHGSHDSNMIPDKDRALYLTDNFKLAEQFAKGEVYGDGLYDGEVATVFTFKGHFNNPYYMTLEEYNDEGQDDELDYQKWIEKGIDGIVLLPDVESSSTYYIAIDLSTIKLIDKKVFTDEYPEELIEREDLTKFNRIAGFYHLKTRQFELFPRTSEDISVEDDEVNDYIHNVHSKDEFIEFDIVRFGIEDIPGEGVVCYIEGDTKKHVEECYYAILEKYAEECDIIKYELEYYVGNEHKYIFLDRYGERIVESLNESVEKPFIWYDPSYSQFHKILRDNTTYGKLSAVIDGDHIYCWDSAINHHDSVVRQIEESGIKLSDDAIWVRFKEPNLCWVSASYFDDYTDDELYDLPQQDFEKELENNPVIRKYFPNGVKITRFDNLVE